LKKLNKKILNEKIEEKIKKWWPLPLWYVPLWRDVNPRTRPDDLPTTRAGTTEVLAHWDRTPDEAVGKCRRPTANGRVCRIIHTASLIKHDHPNAEEDVMSEGDISKFFMNTWCECANGIHGNLLEVEMLLLFNIRKWTVTNYIRKWTVTNYIRKWTVTNLHMLGTVKVCTPPAPTLTCLLLPAW
jgi:hypothetical protein